MAVHRFHPYHPAPDAHHHPHHHQPNAHAGPSTMPAAAHSYAHRRAHVPHAYSNRGPFEVPPSPPFFDYVVDRLVDTVTASLEPAWRPDQSLTSKQQLRWWVETLIAKSRCRTATVLVALAYLDKARPNLRVSSGFLACERALIGAFILANKYTNDEVFSTRAWAHASSTLFTVKEIVRAERELLQVLRFDLSIPGAALMAHYKMVVARCRQHALAISSAAYSPQIPASLQGPHIASSSRYTRYPSNPVISMHRSQRASPASTSSSGSISPVESPEPQTPPAYPYSVPAHAPSDTQRTSIPTSAFTMPYVLANDLHDLAGKLPPSMPAFEDPKAFLPVDGKDFGAIPPTQPSLLAELYGDLDPQSALHSHPAEIAPPFVPSVFPGVLPQQWPDHPTRAVVGAGGWMEIPRAPEVPFAF
ncbi:cyclin N-terminal domain-containing protein [Phanerochaete sordida]|uniref:Cyclin N-terminal domain-containing protein n=1 Tax=Phanerochaete sordida TaxID=48140 RepID=A0A9P3FX88_9APHY|nr:cyclin N-terminal domain-containing protein [Phanerochaete sordida]